MITKLRCWLLVATLLGGAPLASSQTTPKHAELLGLLPDDFAVCVVMHDLQGHWARWEQNAWLKALRESSLGKSILATPEWKQLERWQEEGKNHLGLDWPILRGDILGGTVILSYSPGPKSKPSEEHGLLLLQARNVERLHFVVNKLNEVQSKTGALKSLTTHEYRGVKYHRRNQPLADWFYVQEGTLLAFSNQEATLQRFLDRRAAAVKDAEWPRRFQKAGAEHALLTLCVNPYRLGPEFGQNLSKEDVLPHYWRALEAIFVTLTIQDEAELRVTIQGKVEQLPAWARSPFKQTAEASTLWQRFPRRSLLTIAAQADFAGLADGLKLMLPELKRKDLGDDWQSAFGGLGGALALDPFKQILPILGPDWGVCILPAKNAKQMPQAIFALAAKPGAKPKEPVEQALFRAIQLLAGAAVKEQNKLNPQQLTQIHTLMQQNVEVRYLTNDKVFPAGYQPACALKDGFLLLATSPEVIEQFRLDNGPEAKRSELPLARLSAPELARLIDDRREHILASLTASQKLSERDAKRNLENVHSFLNLLDQVTVSQQGGSGQASWILRLTPAELKRSQK